MRCLALTFLLIVIASCGETQPKLLGACWDARTFGDKERLVGRVTIVVSLPPNDLDVAPMLVSASPTECEHGSFAIEGNYRDRLLREAAHRPAIGQSWDRAFLADVEGVVRLNHSQLEGSHPQAPERIVLSRVRNLTPIARPSWGRW